MGCHCIKIKIYVPFFFNRNLWTSLGIYGNPLSADTLIVSFVKSCWYHHWTFNKSPTDLITPLRLSYDLSWWILIKSQLELPSTVDNY